jgi:ribonuclease BN (tRNA processing enzyme)
MSHFVETLGFRVAACGKTLAYSADTDVCHRLGELVKGADAAIMDATFLAEQKKSSGHMSVMEAAQTSAAGSVKTLVLTHRSPIYDKEQGLAEARAAGFSGEILQPDEGDKLILA